MPMEQRFQIDAIHGADARRMFLELLNRAFQVPADRLFFDDFPIWDEAVVPSSDTLVRLGVFTADRKLAASAGARMAQLSGGLPVALIGGVATDEAYRGLGLASNLVSVAVEWAQTRGATAIFLWGSEHSLYQRLGFELMGEQVMIPLSSLPSQSPSGNLRQGWNPALFDLMRQRRGGLILQPGDLRWISAHRGVSWYWCGREDSPDAYLALGRGIDLPGIIHEWGGKKESLRELLIAVREKHPGASLLGCPEILDSFGIASKDIPREFVCLSRFLEPERASQAFARSPFWIWGLDAV